MGIINQLITGGAPPCRYISVDSSCYIYTWWLIPLSSLVHPSSMGGSMKEAAPEWMIYDETTH